jgi:hypothetical protein
LSLLPSRQRSKEIRCTSIPPAEPPLQAARESGLPSIIHLKIDSDAILPAATLSGIRESALQQA